MLNLVKSKGVSLDLTKHDKGLKKAVMLVEWPHSGIDLDLCALGLQDKSLTESNVCFFNQPNTGWGFLPKDEREGGSEELHIDFSQMTDINKIAGYLTIYEGAQSFSDIHGTKLTISNEETGKVLAEYDMDGLGKGNAFYIGDFVKEGQTISFIPQGMAAENTGLGDILAMNGL